MEQRLHTEALRAQSFYRQKVWYLSLTFFLLSACQAIWRPLKTSIFSKTVGAAFTPDAKISVLFILFPLIIFYSKLVDWLRRHQLLYVFTLFHGLGGLIFTGLLMHPVYGISNTQISGDRWVGWLFYFFMESFSAFLATSFWSFADSVNDPNDAKNCYGFFVIGSKIGGMFSSAILYFVLMWSPWTDNVVLPYSLLIGSLMLCAATATIYMLINRVPGYHLHGYEVAYQIEKHRDSVKTSFWQSIKGAFEGLFIMFKNSYVFGIFLLVLFYEIMIVIFDYRVLVTADATYTTAGELTAYYALYYFCMHGIGLLVSAFGTVPLQRYVSPRILLFLFPLFSLGLLGLSYVFPTSEMFFIILVLLRSLNYAFNHPTREILYIPTTKGIKFKAKAWTDAFGSRVAKGCGSAFNMLIKTATPATALLASTVFSSSLLCIWLVVVFFIGRTMQQAISKGIVIGEEQA
jgi:AAA family ATP:ADP antiporter